jgi:hypothetical protein
LTRSEQYPGRTRSHFFSEGALLIVKVDEVDDVSTVGVFEALRQRGIKRKVNARIFLFSSSKESVACPTIKADLAFMYAAVCSQERFIRPFLPLDMTLIPGRRCLSGELFCHGDRRNALPAAVFLFGNPEVAGSLHIELQFCTGGKSARQPQGHVRGDARLFIDNAGEGFSRNAKTLGKCGYRQVQWLQIILFYQLTRMRWFARYFS